MAIDGAIRGKGILSNFEVALSVRLLLLLSTTICNYTSTEPLIK